MRFSGGVVVFCLFFGKEIPRLPSVKMQEVYLDFHRFQVHLMLYNV